MNPRPIASCILPALVLKLVGMEDARRQGDNKTKRTARTLRGRSGGTPVSTPTPAASSARRLKSRSPAVVDDLEPSPKQSTSKPFSGRRVQRKSLTPKRSQARMSSRERGISYHIRTERDKLVLATAHLLQAKEVEIEKLKAKLSENRHAQKGYSTEIALRENHHSQRDSPSQAGISLHDTDAFRRREGCVSGPTTRIQATKLAKLREQVPV